MARIHVGIDWASRDHAVCAIDQDGHQLVRFAVDHDQDGLDRLVKKLARLGPVLGTQVGIERADGVLVDRLLEAGHQVIPVRPAAIKAFRVAETPSGAKSDAGDAKVIAEYVRVRHQHLRPLEPFSEQTRALRATSRTRSRLVRRRVRATNQLSDTLQLWWPGALAAFPNLDTNIAMQFLGRYPTPEAARHLGPKRMQGFLDRVGYAGNWRRDSNDILAALRSAPAGVGPGPLTDSCQATVTAQVTAITQLRAAIKDLDRTIAGQLDEHPDAPIFLSLPNSGKINAAQLLAEWGDCRQAYDRPDAVAAVAGMCPVTRASGTHHAVLFRQACNTWFRQAMATFADNSRQESDWAADVYLRAKKRVRRHPHAVRILGRAWIRVIWRCWQDRRPYDPALHGAAAALKTA